MRDRQADHDAGPGRERITEILRSALGAPDEEALEDETRRLMLHLSIEPLPNATLDDQPAAEVRAARPGLLRRLLGRARTAPRA